MKTWLIGATFSLVTLMLTLLVVYWQVHRDLDREAAFIRSHAGLVAGCPAATDDFSPRPKQPAKAIIRT